MTASPKEQLYRLRYSSVLHGDDPEATLSVIVATALRKNPALSITGILYFCRETGGLVQVLEGPKANVLALFAKISNDSRHSQCRVLEQIVASSRLFADFGMALAHLDRDLEQDVESRAPSAEHLVRVQYASVLTAGDLREGRKVVEEILRVAVRNNPSRRIGGLLCFNPNTLGIVQVLEGPAPAVRELFTTIMADTRHVGCTLVSEELLLDRGELLFGESWGMMQSETQETNLLGLAPRIRKSFLALRAPEDGDVAGPSLLQLAIDDALQVAPTLATSEMLMLEQEMNALAAPTPAGSHMDSMGGMQGTKRALDGHAPRVQAAAAP
uniref:BLUF domain-containing protein n=1 Tax=Calcidiscus leptoporus TaxID=127549 RepID=A0A7S0J0V9_9EUKA|mmetsp:Transcript_33192/g.77584  ORF Transcript_33192/g.77584 Transcript_33192/m.77584 type:complete len:327 (+) Transcript_33192:32-1012(+)